MTIETTTTLGGLNPALPGGTDEIKEGDDHIRLLKTVIQNDALSLAKLTQQNVLGPMLFNQSVAIAMDLTVAGSIAGNVKFNGINTISNIAPELRFEESDQTDPNGRYRLAGSNGGFGLLKALSANWATYDEIWSHTTLGGFRVSKDAVFGAGLKVEGSTPDIRFVDWDMVDPAGRYRVTVNGDTIAVQRALSANWATSVDIWNYNHATAGFTVPGIATFQSAVTLASSSTISGAAAAVLNFRETEQVAPAGMYRFVVDSNNFYLQRATAADWTTRATIFDYKPSTDVLNLYAMTLADMTATSGSVYPFSAVGLNTSTVYAMRVTDQAGTGERLALYTSPTNQVILRNRNGTGTTVNHLTLAADGSAIISAPAGLSVDGICNLATTNGHVAIGSSTASFLDFQRSGTINYMRVPDAASTAIRVQKMDGTVWATVNSVSGWAAASSDARLKENVADSPYGLDTILALRPVQFDWIAEKRHDIGLIAQEVEEIIPEIVEVWEADPDVEGQIDTYAMRKDALTVVLVKAMQELTARVVALEGA